MIIPNVIGSCNVAASAQTSRCILAQPSDSRVGKQHDLGETMLARVLVTIVMSAFLVACANDATLSSHLGGPSPAPELSGDASKQTLASKVLSAIAFERVTRRKADPARLNELH
jgi:hypothetical protein